MDRKLSVMIIHPTSYRVLEQTTKCSFDSYKDSTPLNPSDAPTAIGQHGIENVYVYPSEEKDSWFYIFIVHIELSFNATDRELQEGDESEDDNNDPILHLKSKYQIVYESEEFLDLTESNEKDFGLYPIEFSWSFWRQFVSDSCFKVGFHPPLPIPMASPEKIFAKYEDISPEEIATEQ